MNYYEVAPNKIVRTGCSTFTYASETPLSIGQIVEIEVGKKTIIGIIVKKVQKPSYETKLIRSSIGSAPLTEQLVKLAIWMSEYYATPLATVLQTILPSGLAKTRRSTRTDTKAPIRNRTNILFNSEQQYVIDTLSASTPGTYLLQGVTGSGKTEVYIELAKQSINNNQSVIIIVPEISLTGQLISEFQNIFSDIVITHSRLTEAARHLAWQSVLCAEKPQIIIGPRSALFMPAKDIGLIVIDESHEPSLKQDQSPKYSALRVATMLGKFHKSKVIFGSATPSITDRFMSDSNNKPKLLLTKPARKNTKPPVLSIVDMTKRSNFNIHRFISDELYKQISNCLSNNKQSLIFHNRRGSTNLSLCSECGWTAACERCHLPLTLHSDKHLLICHCCGQKYSIPTSCPTCGSIDIIHKGIGTKLIESEIKKLFPKARVARFDGDNTTETELNALYSDLYNGTIDIIIGTQVIAKGLDLPNLRLVGVIQADAGLAMPDFNSNERTFQLLAQVVGRVGRNEHRSNVVIQTYQPTHPSVVHGVKQDYESFYNEGLIERKRSHFPPFTYLLKLTCTYKTESAAINNSRKLFNELKNNINPDIKIVGPAPAFYERQHDTYRWQLILKSPRREYLIEAIKYLPPKYWQYDLDPSSLL